MNIKQSGRFKDAPWFPKRETDVIVGGAGGIGSWLTLGLARANFLPMVYDFDTIEEHNIGGQLYAKRHIGSTKVEALADVCKQFADTDITIFNEKYTAESMSHNYVFSAFDNMKARKDMFESWKGFVKEWEEMKDFRETEAAANGTTIEEFDTPIFIDGRLTMEQLQIFCVTPDKISAYEEHLFDDSDVPDAPCTLKQTSHSAAMIASHMVGFFTNHIANNQLGVDDRNLPFMYEYFIPISYTNEM